MTEAHPSKPGQPGRRGAAAVQSVERALDLLEVLAAASEQTGVTELRDATGLPYGTIHRLLNTLVLRGYVLQDGGSRKYMLGSQLVRLGDSAGRFFGSWVRPYLAELVDLSGETANLAVLIDGEAVYVAQVPSPHMMRMFTEVGRRVLPHATAVGKVLLAYGRADVVQRTVDRHGLPAYTERTITDRQALLAELEGVRRQGWALDDGEQEVGVRCVAVPILDAGGSVAAMSVSGPAPRLDRNACTRMIPEMQRVAGAVSGSFNLARPRTRAATGGGNGK